MVNLVIFLSILVKSSLLSESVRGNNFITKKNKINNLKWSGTHSWDTRNLVVNNHFVNLVNKFYREFHFWTYLDNGIKYLDKNNLLYKNIST